MALAFESFQEQEFFIREGDPIGAAATTATQPSGGGGAAPVTQDPWTRLGDVLAGIQAPGIAIPQPQEQSVTYVPTERGNLFWIVLLLAAAGLGYWWYTQRKKGGS